MKRAAFFSTFFLALMILITQVSPVFGQQQTGGIGPANGGGGNAIGPANGGGGNTVVNPSSGFRIQNPLNVDSICGLIKKILAFILAIGMPVAALFLVYSGFMFIIARGNPAALGKAKANLVHVLIGIFIFMGAWMLGQVIANTLKSISPSTTAGVSSCS